MADDGLDRWIERRARELARRTSRRSFLARLGAAPDEEALAGRPEGDPKRCEYWRHCAIDGFLCSCCGGTQRSCPPGTEMSPVTWIGTCRNPSDGKDYVISYNDCCGKDICGVCFCHRNQGDKPIYFPARSNDINWCFGTTSVVYNCSTAIVLGIATE